MATQSRSEAFDKLSELLSEMQLELMHPVWPEDERIAKASDLRTAIFNATQDYVNAILEEYKHTSGIKE